MALNINGLFKRKGGRRGDAMMMMRESHNQNEITFLLMRGGAIKV
jgi:hypothetical protein